MTCRWFRTSTLRVLTEVVRLGEYRLRRRRYLGKQSCRSPCRHLRSIVGVAPALDVAGVRTAGPVPRPRCSALGRGFASSPWFGPCADRCGYGRAPPCRILPTVEQETSPCVPVSHCCSRNSALRGPLETYRRRPPASERGITEVWNLSITERAPDRSGPGSLAKCWSGQLGNGASSAPMTTRLGWSLAVGGRRTERPPLL